MNKTIKTFGTILACLAITGTCLAAPRGGHHNVRHNAPMHHRAPTHHHHAPPPPVVHHHHGGHHCDHCGTGVIAAGAALIGGIIGGLIGN